MRPQPISRRGLIAGVLGWIAAPVGARAAPASLPPADARAFRAWFGAIAEEMARRAPSPRWVHRDCAGLVRFAAREAFADHGAQWRASMGWTANRPAPPDVSLRLELRRAFTQWIVADGQRSDYASALALVQHNTQSIGRDAAHIEAGDLLFFDQGSEQHLMAWTGRRVVYHTGAEPAQDDTGLRITTLAALLQHPDTRWRPTPSNPNFAGWYRFLFVAS